MTQYDCESCKTSGGKWSCPTHGQNWTQGTPLPPSLLGSVTIRPTSTGWQCPVCGKGNAPHVSQCPCRTFTSATGVNIGSQPRPDLDVSQNIDRMKTVHGTTQSFTIGDRVKMNDGYDSDYGGEAGTVVDVGQDPPIVIVLFDVDRLNATQMYPMRGFGCPIEKIE